MSRPGSTNWGAVFLSTSGCHRGKMPLGQGVAASEGHKSAARRGGACMKKILLCCTPQAAGGRSLACRGLWGRDIPWGREKKNTAHRKMWARWERIDRSEAPDLPGRRPPRALPQVLPRASPQASLRGRSHRWSLPGASIFWEIMWTFRAAGSMSPGRARPSSRAWVEA